MTRPAPRTRIATAFSRCAVLLAVAALATGCAADGASPVAQPEPARAAAGRCAPMPPVGADDAAPASDAPAARRPSPAAPDRAPWTPPDLTDPGDILRHGVLVVVNKANPLIPLDFRPADLARVSGHYVAAVAAQPLQELLDAARDAGLQLRTRSGFRSYARQAQVRANVVASLGREVAESQVARPGHSEHQTGLAVDLLPMYGHPCGDMACFGDTPHAAWLAEHAWEFGWIVRYEPGMAHVTGFASEPWHVRYIGREAAAAYRASGARSLEEFLGLPAAPEYLG